MIDLKYLKAIDQAKQLKEAARKIRKEAKKFDDCNVRVRHDWNGDNATQFSGKMRAITEDLNKVASELERSADIIRENAERLHKADEAAARAAMIKNHS